MHTRLCRAAQWWPWPGEGRADPLRAAFTRGVATTSDPGTPHTLSSVEASCRLDAIASAGFGISRSKVISQIKAGRLRHNWQTIRLASRELVVGDRLQLQDRGMVEVLSLTLTKRERWRVELKRT